MTADWVAALHRTKERAEGDLMNALLRGRVVAADQPEPAPAAPVDYDLGVRVCRRRLLRRT